MNLPLDKRLRFGFGLALSLLLMSVVVSFSTLKNVKDSSQWVNHSLEVIATAEHVLSDMQDLETGARGYYIVGEDRFLEPYRVGVERYRADLRALRRLTADNAGQQRRLERLEDRCNVKILVCSKLMSLRDFKRDEIKAVVIRAKAVMDEIRVIVGEVVGEEKRLLQLRSDHAGRSEKPARIILPALILADFLLLSACYYYVLKKMAKCPEA